MQRKDLESAPPGLYLVRCNHPTKPLPDDEVLEGPLADKAPEDQIAANRRAAVLRRDLKCEVEVLQVIAFPH